MCEEEKKDQKPAPSPPRRDAAMARLVLVVLLVALIGGGFYLMSNYEIGLQRDQAGKFQRLTITPRTASGSAQAAAGPLRPTIRVATFDLSRLDKAKLANRRINQILVRTIAEFDIVAVQNIRAANQGLLVDLVELVSADGRQYDFAIDEEVRRSDTQQYSAFLFDKATIGIDRRMVACVEDPQRRFRNKPLVGLFQVLGPAASDAFTFKLVNIHVAPERAPIEVDLLDDVYRAVRDDGLGEDDVILLGGFGVAAQLGPLADNPDMVCCAVDTPTTLRGAQPVDNIVFDVQATSEFTGKAAVFDLVRQFDLQPGEAAEVSLHLPVFAEFSAYEGGSAGRMAALPPRASR